MKIPPQEVIEAIRPLLAFMFAIASLVLIRLAIGAIRKKRAPDDLLCVHEVVGVKITIGTGTVGADRCILRKVEREPSHDGRMITRYVFEAIQIGQ